LKNQTLQKQRRDIFHDEKGFSTFGMVLAILITLSLTFSAAQVYQINSTAADIQNVADAAALAAENEVAYFYTLAQTCDAVVLSLSLTGLALYGLGVVALCIPPTASLGSSLIKYGENIMSGRNKFAEGAASGLNKLQKLLPYLSAANAALVINQNGGGAQDINYVGLAILLPFEGKDIELGPDAAAKTLQEKTASEAETLKQEAQAAEDAADKARQSKERAFALDCGSNPGYCQYERADQLAHLSASENPFYQSVDAWSFSVALKRAQAYYPARLANEQPASMSQEEQAKSALRKRFYTYAVNELSKGYVNEVNTESFDAYFPLLPKNTEEMKATTLYSEVVYPVTRNSSGKLVMHAFSGCSQISSQTGAGTGSIAQMDTSSDYETCSVCGFSAASMGKVASPTSSIGNGFEYYYIKIAEEARNYQRAYEEYAPHAAATKSTANGLLEALESALSEGMSYRIHVSPPGRYGAVALVVNTSVSPVSSNLAHFVNDAGSLGLQAAISSASLANDKSEETKTVISSYLDNMTGGVDTSGWDGITWVLDLWSTLLFAYSEGQDSLINGVQGALDNIPLISNSGLGKWAANALTDLIKTLGLEPAKLTAPKPVLINSAHVLAADESTFAWSLLGIKQSYLSLEGTGSESFFSTVVTQVESQALKSIEGLEEGGIVVSLELFGEGGFSIPLVIPLPSWVGETAKGFISSAAEGLKSLEPTTSGVRRWE
jgi:hypothetical protein